MSPRRPGYLFTFLGTITGWLAVATSAAAQVGFETVGTRAQGMAGAFVAVADDATATYWNPAGLASIPIFDLALGFGQLEQPNPAPAATGSGTQAWRGRNSSIAMGLPALGVSYFRLRLAQVHEPPAGMSSIAREVSNTAVLARNATASSIGVTLVQSLTDAVVIGSTLRLTRVGAASAEFETLGWSEALDAADDLEGDGETKFDADLGVMLYLGQARLGLSVRNLVAPTWDSNRQAQVEAERLARVGLAFGRGPVRGRRVWSIAVDADLTSAEAPDGERRTLAAGAERWFRTSRLAVRGGVRAQTIGDVRPVATGGASVGIWSGLLLEGQVTLGGDEVERGWGLGARVTF
jgi:F plasmid transfer operon, TraF, protein